MVFSPFVVSASGGEKVAVTIEPATQADLLATRGTPAWQTDWSSEYLSDPSIEKYAVKTGEGELVALGAYKIRDRSAYVYILYMESAPHSNPTMKPRVERKYYGIGKLLIAFGIKYSIDHGCRGDVVLEAKTDQLAAHYEAAFQATQIPGETADGPKRYMLVDESAWAVFSAFLEEGSE